MGRPAVLAALHHRTFSTLLVVLVTGAALLAVPAVASANSPYPPTSGCTVSTSTTTVGAGGALSVHGSGFAPGAVVSLRLEPPGTSLGSVTAGGNGSFEVTVSLPSSAAAGDRVVASSAGTTCSFLALVSHRSNGVARSAAEAPAGTANTGFRTLLATAIALGLLAAGTVLVVLGRRRRAG